MKEWLQSFAVAVAVVALVIVAVSSIVLAVH
ncbi:hypothetical protein UFOVP33_54 [uncultured Caudovirales phage]|uniref:Uncharacterized protein n=1 Tax=uncultured Caudovirales phage TaxID=2100421 RepID=A0A6J5KNJ5_9CAUD|nr:hypothetical protein UFOVP33_54 [uncultured Caudovirales phage]